MKNLKKYWKTSRKYLMPLGVLLIGWILIRRNDSPGVVTDFNDSVIPPDTPTTRMQRESIYGLTEAALRAGGYGNLWKNWFAVMAHETGDFKSDLFQKFNNPFGMRLARVRPTTAIGQTKNRGHGQYAIYRNVKDALQDLLFYMQHFKYPKGKTVALSDQVSFMKSVGYFTDNLRNYLNGATTFYNKYFN